MIPAVSKRPPGGSAPQKPRRAGIFGANVRRLRLARGWSQAELAEKAGLSRQGLGNLETGLSRSPDEETAAALAKAFGVKVAQLFEEGGAEASTSGADVQVFKAPSPWQEKDPNRGPPMTVDEFLSKHASSLTGAEQEFVRDQLRTRPGAYQAWTEDDWLALVRSHRRFFPQQI